MFWSLLEGWVNRVASDGLAALNDNDFKPYSEAVDLTGSAKIYSCNIGPRSCHKMERLSRAIDAYAYARCACKPRMQHTA